LREALNIHKALKIGGGGLTFDLRLRHGMQALETHFLFGVGSACVTPSIVGDEEEDSEPALGSSFRFPRAIFKDDSSIEASLRKLGANCEVLTQ